MASDLKRFRQLTWGKPVIMGRKTYASIGRPLDGLRGTPGGSSRDRSRRRGMRPDKKYESAVLRRPVRSSPVLKSRSCAAQRTRRQLADELRADQAQRLHAADLEGAQHAEELVGVAHAGPCLAQALDVDLAVGRVDLANMPAFALSETQLLQQYLDR